MVKCSACSADNAESSAFCSACGAALKAEYAPTVTPETDHRISLAAHDSSSGSSLSDSSHHGRFLPGTRVASRYRIVSLIGKGGMGEVYRADDLKLGQTVALKFLPKQLANKPQRLDCFLREVRLARQISHPNVCRVFDIAEADGQHFLSMEYIDGENLHALLQRIGRLSEDKTFELAKELCAGLAAAHDNGVLHRDLKPANVMIDGRGHARITDFGLAVNADEAGSEVGAGTPLYMAPELLAGREATVQSDLYAFGLVLFRMLTGRNLRTDARLPGSTDEWNQLVTVAQDELSGFAPPVSGIIQRCLDPDPQLRPRTVREVGACLPGRGALEAAVMAGQTPAPDIVVNADVEGRLPGFRAALLLTSGVILLLLCGLLNDEVKLFRTTSLELAPAVLADRARQILDEIGDSSRKPFVASCFAESDVVAPDSATETQRSKRMVFWYRESLRPFSPAGDGGIGIAGVVTPNDPPPAIEDMTTIVLRPDGRLQGLLLPGERTPLPGPTLIPQEAWDAALKHGGFEVSSLLTVTPQLTPPLFCDERRSLEDPDGTRIEGGFLQGQLVWFEVGDLKTSPGGLFVSKPAISPDYSDALWMTFSAIAVLGGLQFARRNLNQGRADVRSGVRLAVYLLVIHQVSWLLVSEHSQVFAVEMDTFLHTLGVSVFWSGAILVAYLAVEPDVRRVWPWRIVSWSRLLDGRLNDPLVGRDILMGSVLGGSWTFLHALNHVVPQWLGIPSPPAPLGKWIVNLTEPIAPILMFQETAIRDGCIWFLLLFLLVLLLRREWAAIVVTLLLIGTMMAFADPARALVKAPLAAAAAGLMVFTGLRFGVLAVVVGQYWYHVWLFTPITYDSSAWYFTQGGFAAGSLLFLVAYGFWICRGDEPLLRVSTSERLSSIAPR